MRMSCATNANSFCALSASVVAPATSSSASALIASGIGRGTALSRNRAATGSSTFCPRRLEADRRGAAAPRRRPASRSRDARSGCFARWYVHVWPFAPSDSVGLRSMPSTANFGVDARGRGHRDRAIEDRIPLAEHDLAAHRRIRAGLGRARGTRARSPSPCRPRGTRRRARARRSRSSRRRAYDGTMSPISSGDAAWASPSELTVRAVSTVERLALAVERHVDVGELLLAALRVEQLHDRLGVMDDRAVGLEREVIALERDHRIGLRIFGRARSALRELGHLREIGILRRVDLRRCLLRPRVGGFDGLRRRGLVAVLRSCRRARRTATRSKSLFTTYLPRGSPAGARPGPSSRARRAAPCTGRDR